MSKQKSPQEEQEDVTDVSMDDTDVSKDVSEDAMDDCEVPESDLDLTPWL